MKLVNGFFLSLIGLAFAHCTARAEWVPVFSNGTFVSSAKYGGASVSLSENFATVGPLSDFSLRVSSYYEQVKMELNQQVEKRATTEGLSFNGGSISGDLKLSFAGGVTANPNDVGLEFSGLSYVASVSKSDSALGGIISGSCTVKVRFSEIRFSVVYDITTGHSVRVQAANLNPSQEVSCSTSLDWLPLVGDLLTDFLEGRVSLALGGAMQSLSDKVTRAIEGQQLPYLGFLSSIGYGQYMVNGFDVGAYAKNNFTNFFIGNTVTMKLNDPDSYTVLKNSAVSTDRLYPRFSIEFSGAAAPLAFTLEEKIHYNYVWKCKASGPACQQP